MEYLMNLNNTKLFLFRLSLIKFAERNITLPRVDDISVLEKKVSEKDK